MDNLDPLFRKAIGALAIEYMRCNNLPEEAEWFAARIGHPPNLMDKQILQATIIRWLWFSDAKATAYGVAQQLNLPGIIRELEAEDPHAHEDAFGQPLSLSSAFFIPKQQPYNMDNLDPVLCMGIGALGIEYLRDNNLPAEAKRFAARFGYPANLMNKPDLQRNIIRWLWSSGSKASAGGAAKQFNMEEVITALEAQAYADAAGAAIAAAACMHGA